MSRGSSTLQSSQLREIQQLIAQKVCIESNTKEPTLEELEQQIHGLLSDDHAQKAKQEVDEVESLRGELEAMRIEKEEERQKAIARAKEIRRSENEVVRKLNGKLMVCDLMHANKQLTAIKQRMKEQDMQELREELDRQRQEYINWQDREKAKSEERRREKQEWLAEINQQLKVKHERMAQEQAEQMQYERELVESAQKAEKLKQTQRIQAKREKRLRVIEEQRKFIEQRKEQVKAQEKAAEEEDAECARYFEEKQRIWDIRKAKQQRREDELKRVRAEMIARQAALLEDLKQQESARVEREQIEAENREKDRQMQSDSEKQKLLDECIQHIHLQREQKLRDKQESLRMEKEMLLKANLDKEKFDREQVEMAKKRREAELETLRELKKQILVKRRRDFADHKSDRDFMKNIIEQDRAHAQELSEWSKARILAFKNMGLNVAHLAVD